VHAVFFSWPHSSSRRTEEIVSTLASDLEDSFRDFPGIQQPRVFFDRTRLLAGYKWDEQLRYSLARSAVTVVILVPTYFFSDYCPIEWAIASKLGPAWLPANERRTCVLPLQLVSQDELEPPEQVGAVQFVKEFEELLVWGDKVRSHPSWNKLVEELRRLIFELLKEICATERNWAEEEAVAKTCGPCEFTWPPPAAALAQAAFPHMKSVEPR